MTDMNENAETQQEYFGRVKLETDYKDLSIILYKRIAELEAYNEKLLNGDIEKHNKIVELEKENAELKANNKALKEKVHWWKKEVNVAHRARADEFEKLVIENKVLKRKLTYAKTIIQDLLDNSDEYARQRAEQFLGELDETIRV